MKSDPTTKPGHDPRRDLLERDDYLKHAEDERVRREMEKYLRGAARKGGAGAGRRWDR